MERYYFHLRDGVDVLMDEEGRQLTGMAALEEAALLEARSMISSDALEGHVRLDMRIDVETSAGVIVHSLAFKDAIEIVPPHI